MNAVRRGFAKLHPGTWMVSAISLVVAALLYQQAWLRYATFHNETFDLALYGRMAWGMVRGAFWDPVTNANTFGVHISPILFPVGLLGEVVGYAQASLGIQALALSATALPLFVIARREFGLSVSTVLAVCWWVYPHIFHVATFEFHPGSLAVFPLMCAVASDRDPSSEPPRAWWIWLGLALLCREDISLSVACVVLMRSRNRTHLAVASGCVLYFIVFAFTLVPLLGPEKNSVVLHFGRWGQTLPQIAWFCLTHPGEFVSYLFSPDRVRYLGLLVGLLAMLPVLGARWLLPAAPFVGMNLLSAWPTAIALDSHYQTLILPFLFLAAIDGLALIKRHVRFRHVEVFAATAALVCATVGHAFVGGSAWSGDFKRGAYRVDAAAKSARKTIDAIGPTDSVQAPYGLMPHLMTRSWIAPTPPPDRDFEIVVLDLSSRAGYRGDDTVLRTDEEPELRAWLGRTDYGIVEASMPFVVLKRGASARDWAQDKGYLLKSSPLLPIAAMTGCLGFASAVKHSGRVRLMFLAAGGCDKDLAIRFGDTYRPVRVELLFDGLLNPAQLQKGDVVFSEHEVSADELLGMEDTGVCVGAVRQSGVRPTKSDPVSVCLPLGKAPAVK